MKEFFIEDLLILIYQVLNKFAVVIEIFYLVVKP